MTLRFLVFAMCSLALSAIAHAANVPVSTLVPGKLQVCLFAWPPFAEKQDDGAWSGWDVDYLRSFAKTVNLSLEVVEMREFRGIWNGPGLDRCDIAGTGISYLRTRAAETGEAGHWSGYYYRVERAYLVRSADADNLHGLQDLVGKTVIVTDQSTAHQDLVNRMKAENITDVKITFTNDEVLAAKTIRDASAPDGPFAYGAGLGSVKDLAASLGGLSVVWEHCNMLADGTERDEPFSFVVRSASTGLPELLDSFIAERKVPYAGGAGADTHCSGGAP